jgi:hypothetical protein
MIDALIKRVSVTYKCYKMYAHRGGKRCNCLCFEVDQEMEAIDHKNYMFWKLVNSFKMMKYRKIFHIKQLIVPLFAF